jgi:predicted nucleotidyltransferase
MKGTVQSLLTELRSELERAYGQRLRGLYLYGSYARGEQQWDSDVDVLIVLDHISSYGAEIDRTGEFVARISLDYGVSVSRVFVSEDAWRSGTGSFLANVREEAIAASIQNSIVGSWTRLTDGSKAITLSEEISPLRKFPLSSHKPPNS